MSSVVVQRREFTAALKLVSRAADVHFTQPILSYVELGAGQGSVKLRCHSFSENIEISTRVLAEGNGAFVMNVPAARLLRIFSALEATRVSLRTDGNYLHIEECKLHATEFRILHLAEQMPTHLPLSSEPPCFAHRFPEHVLHGLLTGVAHAVSDEETRHYLQGACMEIGAEPSVLRFTSTNGHVLESRCTTYGGGGGEIPGSAIIPTRAVRAILASPPDVEAEVRLFSVHEPAKTGRTPSQDTPERTRVRHGTVVLGDTEITFVMVDGTFPDWRRIVPHGVGSAVRVDSIALMSALRKVRAHLTTRYRGIGLVPVTGGLWLRAKDDMNDFRCFLPAEIEGVPMPFGVNQHYLLNAVSTAVGKVTLRLLKEGDPIRIETADPGAISIIMPMRMGAEVLRKDWEEPKKPEPVKARELAEA